MNKKVLNEIDTLLYNVLFPIMSKKTRNMLSIPIGM